jgi:hypothetical protein
VSILVRYAPEGMTVAMYEAVSEQLEGALDWPPDGLEYHVCFGTDGDLMVSEIWESQEQFDAFGEKAMPVLSAGGIRMSREPEILPVHHAESVA